MIPKGTKIRITNADVLSMGLYKNGDVLITARDDDPGAMVQFDVPTDFGDGPGLLYIMRSEFEVVE